MNIGTIFLILLLIFLLGGGSYGHFSGASWAGTYGNGGIGIGFILLIVVVVLLVRGGL